MIHTALSLIVVVALIAGFALYVVPNLDPMANESIVAAVAQIVAVPAGGALASASVIGIHKLFGAFGG